MSGAAIALTRVTRAYDGRRVVDDATLTAPAGRILALLGPSGSGKSTILRIIAGLEPIDAGEVRLGGAIVSSPGATAPPETRRIGLVFQDYALFPHLDATHNVAFGLDALPREARIAAARAWLQRVGLGARAHAYPHELSGGEQQRVALARALAPSPRAILLDEPFSGLDPALRAELRQITLDAIAETGATGIFVTHHADEALLVADRLAILKNGRVLQESDARAAYDSPVSAEAAAALGPVNIVDAVVENGHASTPFGVASVSGHANGAHVQIVVRAEALRLGEGGDAQLIDRRPQGAFDLVRVRAGDSIWNALVAPRMPLPDRLRTSLDPAGTFVFAR